MTRDMDRNEVAKGPVAFGVRAPSVVAAAASIAATAAATGAVGSVALPPGEKSSDASRNQSGSLPRLLRRPLGALVAHASCQVSRAWCSALSRWRAAKRFMSRCCVCRRRLAVLQWRKASASVLVTERSITSAWTLAVVGARLARVRRRTTMAAKRRMRSSGVLTLNCVACVLAASAARSSATSLW